MAAAGSEIAELVLSWVVQTGFTFAVVIVDERKILREDGLERAWPPASRDAAVVAFGPLALLVHFPKTRFHLKTLRGALGLPLGILAGMVAVVLVAVASGLVLEGLSWAFGFGGV